MPRKRSPRRLRPLRKVRQTTIRREEFNRLIELLNERGTVVNTLLRDQQIQFRRIADMQAELDIIRATLARLVK